MNTCNINIEVDLFEYRNKIIKNLGTEELELELKKRKEQDIDVKKRLSLMVEFPIDVSDYDVSVLEELSDGDLSDELEDRGIHVYDSDEFPAESLCNKKEIAKILGLREWATTEQILEELKYIL